jgi:hypothetical protein
MEIIKGWKTPTRDGSSCLFETNQPDSKVYSVMQQFLRPFCVHPLQKYLIHCPGLF